ncbi:cytidine deaminase [Ornithobacterium rhinotracheale]|uniref:Cytidine deaminase n=1 Tax=Ornithobacterium rhinotracheale (strain ATCC 51463 / DSM 15997 / CCUG 23171 / CIP 104009 / LMG 9086) TaxID=867902 RepID=I4A290_ORNRL|nr:cytidine deaminase [Ornithobacterium rhinotracheale]AFL98074.1 cytidine deaminase [Ornithobacterium rhinotracheale DSM 15997]AIP99848.1 cytidine deaminase [Ornithobacterium rhinotracheale ORT-UMN 88]KGB66039.1 cytidine deaminase [Ornithobacterium rhinotracheale H06-030791]MCK0193633.1 cytidine deaminase [Ornithobacterium rhinotracheale]MCK0199268.1 cytidine deaminase [Ornithobacterium rhinotracheale]
MKEWSFKYEIFSSEKELSSEDKMLLAKAKEAKDRAYAPYSKFQVGCSLLLDNGEVFTGNNQENAAYPSGLCAERVAIFAAKSQNPDAVVKKIFITTSAENMKEAISPCGACRQVLVEYEKNQFSKIEIYFQGAEAQIIKLFSVCDLLPFTFHSEMLGE